MNFLLDAALELQSFCRDRGWQSCIIGGLAALRWGRPRATQDVDLSLLTGFGDESEFIKPLLERMSARVSGAAQFAAEHRVPLLRASNGVPLDVALAAIPFEERMMRRASEFDFSANCALTTASAEDLMVLKAFSGRPRDWADVEGIVSRRFDVLDWRQIEDELTSLCEATDSSEAFRRLTALRAANEKSKVEPK